MDHLVACVIISFLYIDFHDVFFDISCLIHLMVNILSFHIWLIILNVRLFACCFLQYFLGYVFFCTKNDVHPPQQPQPIELHEAVLAGCAREWRAEGWTCVSSAMPYIIIVLLSHSETQALLLIEYFAYSCSLPVPCPKFERDHLQ
jgi:hypothetical protein